PARVQARPSVALRILDVLLAVAVEAGVEEANRFHALTGHRHQLGAHPGEGDIGARTGEDPLRAAADPLRTVVEVGELVEGSEPAFFPALAHGVDVVLDEEDLAAGSVVHEPVEGAVLVPGDAAVAAG